MKIKKYEMATQKENLQIDLEESKTVLEILRKQKVNLEKNQLEKEKNKILKENILKDENKVKIRRKDKRFGRKQTGSI